MPSEAKKTATCSSAPSATAFHAALTSGGRATNGG